MCKPQSIIIIAVLLLSIGRDDFACSADEFECTQSETCTRLRWKCDGVEDCLDGEDEVGCKLMIKDYPASTGRC